MVIDLANQSDLELLGMTFDQMKLCVGLTSGCYDLLHFGHMHYLKRCKRLCDVLIVGVDSDERVKLLKGDERPIISVVHRIEMVHALRYVDIVFELDKLDDLEILSDRLGVNKIFRNDDFAGHEGEVVGAGGGAEVVIVEDVKLPGSTTAIIEEVVSRSTAPIVKGKRRK